MKRAVKELCFKLEELTLRLKGQNSVLFTICDAAMYSPNAPDKFIEALGVAWSAQHDDIGELRTLVEELFGIMKKEGE